MLDSMQLTKVLDILRGLAPESLAEDWDKVGLHVGDPAQTVSKAMLCIDLTEPVLDEAIAAGVELIVAYHPPIFSPLSSVTTGDVKSRIIYRAVREGVAIYSPHTALDAAEGGVNDWLAAGLGKGKVRPIRPTAAAGGYKVVVFVPHDDADAVRDAMAAAGGGNIGDYSACSFGVAGEGTFRGGDSTNPAVGQRGRFERVSELRMEMVVNRAALAGVVAAMVEAHPYEEPAFDVYRVENAKPQAAATGQGRVVELDEPVTLDALVARIAKRLKVKHLDVAKAGRGKVRRVGLCAGAGGSLLADSGDIDAFFTGEMRHHDVLAAVADGVSVILAGHTQTERPYLATYRKRIAAAGGEGIKWAISRKDQPPSAITTNK